MPTDEAALAKEVAKLREELRQMREIVDMLVSVVMENEEDEEVFEPPFRASGDDRRFNLLT